MVNYIFRWLYIQHRLYTYNGEHTKNVILELRGRYLSCYLSSQLIRISEKYESRRFLQESHVSTTV